MLYQLYSDKSDIPAAKKEEKEEEEVKVEEEVKTGAPNSTLQEFDEFSQFEKTSFFKQKAQKLVTVSAISNALGKKGNERFEMKKLRMESNLGVKF